MSGHCNLQTLAITTPRCRKLVLEKGVVSVAFDPRSGLPPQTLPLPASLIPLPPDSSSLCFCPSGRYIGVHTSRDVAILSVPQMQVIFSRRLPAYQASQGSREGGGGGGGGRRCAAVAFAGEGNSLLFSSGALVEIGLGRFGQDVGRGGGGGIVVCADRVLVGSDGGNGDRLEDIQAPPRYLHGAWPLRELEGLCAGKKRSVDFYNMGQVGTVIRTAHTAFEEHCSSVLRDLIEERDITESVGRRGVGEGRRNPRAITVGEAWKILRLKIGERILNIYQDNVRDIIRNEGKRAAEEKQRRGKETAVEDGRAREGGGRERRERGKEKGQPVLPRRRRPRSYEPRVLPGLLSSQLWRVVCGDETDEDVYTPALAHALITTGGKLLLLPRKSNDAEVLETRGRGDGDGDKDHTSRSINNQHASTKGFLAGIDPVTASLVYLLGGGVGEGKGGGVKEGAITNRPSTASSHHLRLVPRPSRSERTILPEIIRKLATAGGGHGFDSDEDSAAAAAAAAKSPGIPARVLSHLESRMLPGAYLSGLELYLYQEISSPRTAPLTTAARVLMAAPRGREAVVACMRKVHSPRRWREFCRAAEMAPVAMFWEFVQEGNLEVAAKMLYLVLRFHGMDAAYRSACLLHKRMETSRLWARDDAQEGDESNTRMIEKVQQFRDAAEIELKAG
eukprot:jgi/Bigna1/76020/fgenesh1_pg.38_\